MRRQATIMATIMDDMLCPGRQLRPGCTTQEWPCTVGQATCTLSACVLHVAGLSRASLAPIRVCIRLSEAHFGAYAWLGSGQAMGHGIVGLAYNNYALKFILLSKKSSNIIDEISFSLNTSGSFWGNFGLFIVKVGFSSTIFSPDKYL